MKHPRSPQSSSESCLESRADNPDGYRKKHYTGTSRTTRWRRRKRREAGMIYDDSSTESDEVQKPITEFQAGPRERSAEKEELQQLSPGPTSETPIISPSHCRCPSMHDTVLCLDIAEEHLKPIVKKDPSRFKNKGGESPLCASEGTFCLYDVAHSTKHHSPGSSTEDFHRVQSSVEQNVCAESSDTDDAASYTSSGSEYRLPSSGCESASSAEFSSDLECFVAHYLEEEPEDPPAFAHPHDLASSPDNSDSDDQEGEGSDPDDPHNPGSGNESGSTSSGDSEDDNEYQVATFHNQHLNRNVHLFQNLTKGEIILLELACAVRHQKTFENIIDQFKIFNLLFGPGCFPQSKTKLWSDILLNKAGIQFHVYCGRQGCGRYISRKDRIIEIARCRCGYRVPVQKAKFFVTMDLPTQLKYFLSIPGMWNKLQYPLHRQKNSPTAIEDVLDGALYVRLKQEGGPLSNPYNFSFIFNLDGCNPTKKGSLKVYPLYLRLNELPPEMRQKFHFPAAVYVDHVDPNYQSFLKPFVRQVRHLATHGLNWKPDGVNEVNSKFIPLGFNVDSPVRYSILNMSKWDAPYGCTYCTHRGVREAGSQRYPTVNLEGIPPFADRTHQGMIDAMRLVEGGPNVDVFEGHKGASVLILLADYLDLRDGQAEDDLHQDHEGSAADLTDLLLSTPEARVVENMPYVRLCRTIDNRLLSIKTPSRIARKPRSIVKRGTYKGTEWRNWLIFYAVPCLVGLIKPEYLDILASLSHACYLLSQDSIEPEDINSAERLLNRVSTRFEETFGVGRIKYNLHVTTKHKVHSVRNLGNPYAYSTYNFESLNRRMMGKVTSPKGAILQIVTRALLHMTVYGAQYDERLSEEVRLKVDDILNPYQLQRVRQVGPHLYLVGRGNQRDINNEETEVLVREGINARIIEEFKSFLYGNTRYRSLAGQNQEIKSDDSFIYSSQQTFCTIRTIFSFVNENGEENYGAFVTEHDVRQVVPVARHISILQNANADLLHFIYLHQVRCPAVKINTRNTLYATCVPNCFEID